MLDTTSSARARTLTKKPHNSPDKGGGAVLKREVIRGGEGVDSITSYSLH